MIVKLHFIAIGEINKNYKKVLSYLDTSQCAGVGMGVYAGGA